MTNSVLFAGITVNTPLESFIPIGRPPGGSPEESLSIHLLTFSGFFSACGKLPTLCALPDSRQPFRCGCHPTNNRLNRYRLSSARCYSLSAVQRLIVFYGLYALAMAKDCAAQNQEPCCETKSLSEPATGTSRNRASWKPIPLLIVATVLPVASSGACL